MRRSLVPAPARDTRGIENDLGTHASISHASGADEKSACLRRRDAAHLGASAGFAWGHDRLRRHLAVTPVTPLVPPCSGDRATRRPGRRAVAPSRRRHPRRRARPDRGPRRRAVPASPRGRPDPARHRAASGRSPVAGRASRAAEGGGFGLRTRAVPMTKGAGSFRTRPLMFVTSRRATPVEPGLCDEPEPAPRGAGRALPQKASSGNSMIDLPPAMMLEKRQPVSGRSRSM